MKEVQKQLRLVIITTNVILLLILFFITISAFAYGIGKVTYLYLILYPLFIVSTILIIVKLRLGTVLSFLIAIFYCVLLTNEVGRYFVFNFHNFILFWVLALPYLLFLILIPLTIIYLMDGKKYKNLFVLTSLIISFGFIIYPIFDRLDKKYEDNIYIEVKISKAGKIILYCRPSFGDSRNFILINNSNEFENQIKKYGEYYQGTFYLKNTIVTTNFRFNQLKSLTITKINDKVLIPELIWKKEQILGDTEFLTPHN